MRLLHIADLHIGKRVCEFSMLDDQRYILEQILSLLDKTPVDGVLLAGDLYDKPVPPAEAVRLLDWFLTQLAERRLPVFAISGNHDSADRIAFGAALLQNSRVYVSPVFSGAPVPIPLTDEYGTLDVYLLPFLKPAMVRHVWPDEPVESYNDALACVLRHCPPDPAHRSVLVAHQFVAGAACCESEEVSVGGVDSVDASLFDAFDYVALGHLHRAQQIGNARYSGSIMQQDFGESGQMKQVLLIDVEPGGQPEITEVPLITGRYLARWHVGSLDEARAMIESGHDAQGWIELTIESPTPPTERELTEIMRSRERIVYARWQGETQCEESKAIDWTSRPRQELFESFYKQTRGRAPSRDTTALFLEMISDEGSEADETAEADV